MAGGTDLGFRKQQVLSSNLSVGSSRSPTRKPAARPASWLFRASGSPRARALRTIVEESLLEVMYDIPDRTEIRKCIITEETIRDGRPPLLLTKTEVDGGVDETNYAEWLATQGATA